MPSISTGKSYPSYCIDRIQNTEIQPFIDIYYEYKKRTYLFNIYYNHMIAFIFTYKYKYL